MSKPTIAIIQDRRYKDRDGCYPIKIRVTYNRVQKYYPTGRKCTPDEYDIVRSGLGELFSEVKKIIERSFYFRFDEFEKQYQAILDKITITEHPQYNLNLTPSKTLFDIPKTPGIYFLFQNEDLIYIGSSMCLKRRILSHRHRKRIEFDSIKYLQLPDSNREDIEAREAYLIIAHNFPKHNSVARRPSFNNLKPIYAQ